MPKIEWTYEDEDGEEITIELLACWQICGRCHGEGKHSLAVDGHGITQEERDQDWSHDEWEAYMAGEYDQECEVCRGAGKVLAVDEDRIPKELRERYWDDKRGEAEYEQICRMERRMGA